MHDTTCPLCGEPLDQSGACVACDYAETDEPLEFSDTDLYLLTHSLEGVAR